MDRIRSSLVLAALTLAMLGSPSTADAQTAGALTAGGMDLHLFRPAMDSKGHLSVNGTDVLPDLGISFGLLLDGGFGMLPYTGFVNDNTLSDEDANYCAGRSDLLCGRVVDTQFTGRCTSTSASPTC